MAPKILTPPDFHWYKIGVEADADAVKVTLVPVQNTLSASLLVMLTAGSDTNAATEPAIEKSGVVAAFTS